MTPENGWLPTTQSSGSRLNEQQHQHQQLLAERDAELRALRSTMEKNEAAILRAMDDQRRAWEKDIAAERESWECRLRDAEQQVDDVRHTLTQRVRDLEHENAALHQLSNVEHVQHNRSHGSTHLRRTTNSDEQLATPAHSQRGSDELSDVGGSFRQLSVNGVERRQLGWTHESTTWTERCAITPSAVEQRRATLTELNNESDPAASRLPPIPEGPARRCQHCEATNSELERAKQEFDAERQQWLTEKRRVIAYQKLLQSKYVQLERRCAELDGSTATDSLNHMECVDGITACNYFNGLALPLRGAWKMAQAESSSSSSSSSLPRLIPFGQSIET